MVRLRSHRGMPTLTSFGGLVMLSACNDILDIRAAAPKPGKTSDASAQTAAGTAGTATSGTGGKAGGTVGSGGHSATDADQGGSAGSSSGTVGTSSCDAATGVCAQVATEECRTCLETKCSGELAACLREPFCRDAMIEYSSKLICSCCSDQGDQLEALQGAGQEANDFADCLKARCLPSTCSGQGLSCFVYCECMSQDHCENQRAAWDGGSCWQHCMNAPDIACQADHCEIARAATHPIDVQRHCGHAVGISCCNVPGFLCPTPSPLCH